MKQIAIILFFISSFNLFSQVNIPIEYQTDYATPLLFLKGEKLNIQIDSAYIVNSKTMHFYNELHKGVLENDFSDINSLNNLYQEQVQFNAQQFRVLRQNQLNLQNQIRTQTDKMQGLSQEEKTRIKEIEKTIQEQRIELQEGFNLLKKDTKTLKRKRFFRGLKNTLIGIGIGSVSILVLNGFNG